MFVCPSQVFANLDRSFLHSKYHTAAAAPAPCISYNNDHITLNIEAKVALQAKVNHI